MLHHVATLKGHTDRVWYCEFSPCGRLIATCGGDKTIRIFSQRDWTLKFTLNGVQSRTIRSLSWSPCGRYIAAASFDATIAIWSFINGDWECVATLEGHENEIKSVAWDANGQFLASCSRDKSIWIWEATDENDFECASILHGHEQDVKKVRWHRERKELISASYDDTIKVWCESLDSDEEWECRQTLRAHSGTVWATTWHPNASDRFASCGDDMTVKIWDAGAPDAVGFRSYSNIATLAGHHSRVIFSVDWSKQGYLASGGADDKIVIYEEGAPNDPALPHVPGYRVVLTAAHAHAADINCVVWNPSEPDMLASASDDNTVKIWRFLASANADC